MRGLTREERHQWHGQPGHWTCKRCYARMEGSGPDDGICSASLRGRLDYSGHTYTCPDCGLRDTLATRRDDWVCPCCRPAGPTRLDTPETVDKSARQGGLGEPFRSTGKGRQVSPEQGDKR